MNIACYKCFNQNLIYLYKYEMELFKQKFHNEEMVINVIEYYQENKLDVFVKRRN